MKVRIFPKICPEQALNILVVLFFVFTTLKIFRIPTELLNKDVSGNLNDLTIDDSPAR